MVRRESHFTSNEPLSCFYGRLNPITISGPNTVYHTIDLWRHTHQNDDVQTGINLPANDFGMYKLGWDNAEILF
jgi:hypothetical protein